MDAVTNLINKIKSRWDGETTIHTEFDTIKILELMHERMIEIDQDMQHPKSGRVLEILNTKIEDLEGLVEYYKELTQILRDENAHLKQVAANHHNNWMTSQRENARLHEQLRWHDVSELPPFEKGSHKYSVDVFLWVEQNIGVIAYYHFLADTWINFATNQPIHELSEHSKWMYFPSDDNQGTDCTPEGE